MTSKPAPLESALRVLSSGAGLEVSGHPQRERGVGPGESGPAEKLEGYLVINVHISGCQVAISKIEVVHKAVTVRPWKPRRPDGRRGFQGRTVTAL